MLKISIITSYRFLVKSKTYTFINLFGLVLGLTAVYILFTFLINELSFNSCFKESDRLFRVLMSDRKKGTQDALSALVVAPTLKKQIPEIEETCRIINPANIIGPVTITKSNIFYKESNLISADPSILDLFPITIIKGKKENVLAAPSSVIISAKTSERYFGETNAIGKTLIVKANGNIFYFVVRGVFSDLPWNSSYKADFITNLKFIEKILQDVSADPQTFFTSFGELLAETIVRLKPGTGATGIETMLRTTCRIKGLEKTGYEIKLQGLREMYLESGNIQNDFLPKGNPSNLIIYSSLAIFILLLAGINYSILSTARAALRFKEIGVKKVLGASRKVLRNQIMTESILLTFLAFPLAFLLLGLINPLIRVMYGFELKMYVSNFALYFILFATITLLIGFLSGTYVALYLSSLDPLHALKLRLFSYRKFSLGKVFTIFQLFITLSLLICFITVYRQMRYCFLQDKKVKMNNILLVNFDAGEFSGYTVLRKDVAKIMNVISVSGISISFPSNATNDTRLRVGTPAESDIIFENYLIDFGFFYTLGVPLESGKEFQQSDNENLKSSLIINQTFKTALKERDNSIDMIGDQKILGVVSDFHMGTLHTRIKPAMFRLRPEKCKSMLVRYEPEAREQVIADIGRKWRKIAPDLPFSYQQYNEELAVLYKRDENFQNIVASFTFLAFLITGMGLFGLAILLSERKIREVAIRKVFGASNLNIVYEMQKDFFTYIAASAVLSIPLSWYFMDRWLSTFYYHENVSLPVVVLSVLSVALFVSAILFLRTRKVLNNNPLMALKYE